MTPVIGINGIMIGRSAWMPFAHEVEDLGRAFYPYVPPGFDGRPRMPGHTPSPSEWAKDMVRTLDHLGVERAHLVAHCSGCNIAVTAAVEYPNRFASVLLMAFWHRTKEWESRLEIQRVGVRSYAKSRVASLVSRRAPTYVREALVDDIVEATTDTEAFLQIARMLCQYNSKPDFLAVKQPMGVVVGLDDYVTSPDAQINVAASKGAMTCVLPGIGHCPHIEAPLAVASFGSALWRRG